MELEVGLSGWVVIEEELWGEEVYAVRKVEGVQRLLSQGKSLLPKEEVDPMQGLLYQYECYQMQNDRLSSFHSVQVENMAYDRRDFGEGTPLPKNNLNRFKFPRLYHDNSLLTASGYHYDDDYWKRD